MSPKKSESLGFHNQGTLTRDQYYANPEFVPSEGISLKGTQEPVEVSAVVTDEEMRLKSACLTPGASVHHFPPAHNERKAERLEREEKAKAVCGSCAVKAACLERAIERRESYGIWGGLNETELKQVIKSRSAK